MTVLTPKDILAKAHAISGSPEDPQGVAVATLVKFLPYRFAKEFLKEEFHNEVGRKQWEEQSVGGWSYDTVVHLMRAMYPTVWRCANEAHLSPRSHELVTQGAYCYRAWLWLLADPYSQQMSERIMHACDYYFKPMLSILGFHFNLSEQAPWYALDNGQWVASNPSGRIIRGRREALAEWSLRHPGLAQYLELDKIPG